MVLSLLQKRIKYYVGHSRCSRKDFNRGVIDNKKVLKALKNK